MYNIDIVKCCRCHSHAIYEGKDMKKKKSLSPVQKEHQNIVNALKKLSQSQKLDVLRKIREVKAKPKE